MCGTTGPNAFLPAWIRARPNTYRDIDPGPAKNFMMEHRRDPAVANLFELGFGKRPAEELYDLRSDTAELRNVATDRPGRRSRRGWLPSSMRS